MKLRPFELGLVIFFGVLILLAFVLINTHKPAPKDGAVNLGGQVTIWGTLPAGVFSSIISDLSNRDDAYRRVSYRYIAPENFDNVFINALADQNSPDLLLMSHEKLVTHRSRLQPIPFESFPVRDFRNLYLEGASVFTLNDGVYAFPVAVDPIVMYWNRDILSNNGFLVPPVTWEEIVSETAPALTVRDFNRNVQRSTIAMGEYSNVKNAFQVLSLLLLQAGSVMVTEDGRRYRIRLNEAIGGGSQPLTSSLGFFTSFSNVNNSLYNWNRSLPLDRELFLRENLVFYFGFGSEARDLESKNPNLNFDIAEVPQGATATNKRTYGSFYGFFLPRAAKNKNGAIITMQTLSSQTYAKRISDANNLAPVYKQSIQQGSNDVYGRIIYSSAINARGWLNPDLNKAGEVIRTTLEDISSNRRGVSGAASDTNQRLQQTY